MDICKKKKGCNLYQKTTLRRYLMVTMRVRKIFPAIGMHWFRANLHFQLCWPMKGMSCFSDDEYELLWFMATVIYTSTTQANGQIKTYEAEVMSELEEKQLAENGGSQRRKFSWQAQCIFQDYPRRICLHLWKTVWVRWRHWGFTRQDESSYLLLVKLWLTPLKLQHKFDFQSITNLKIVL